MTIYACFYDPRMAADPRTEAPVIPMLHGTIAIGALAEWQLIGKSGPFYSNEWESSTTFYRKRMCAGAAGAHTQLLICEHKVTYVQDYEPYKRARDDTPIVTHPRMCPDNELLMCNQNRGMCMRSHWRVVDAREFVFVSGSIARTLCVASATTAQTWSHEPQHARMHIFAATASMRRRRRVRYTTPVYSRRPIVWCAQVRDRVMCSIPVNLSGIVPVNSVCRGFACAPEHHRDHREWPAEIPMVLRRANTIAIWNRHADTIVISRAHAIYTYASRVYVCDGARMLTIDGRELVNVDSEYADNVRAHGREIARVRVRDRRRGRMHGRVHGYK